MKIALLTSYSMHIPGGVQKHMVDQAAALSELGHDVEILAADIEDSVFPLPVNGVNCGPSLKIKGNGSVANLAYSPVHLFKIWKQLKRFDIVHIHEPFYPFTNLLVLMTGIPCVATFHVDRCENPYYRYAKYPLFMNFVWKRLKRRIAVSEEARKTINNYFKGDVVIVPNGINLPKRMPSVTAAGKFRKKSNSILFFGRNEPRKGLPLLLDAFSEIRKKIPEVELLIAGPGTKNISGDGIKSFGYVDEVTREKLFREAACYCAPATGGESFGIVLLEAMAHGLPIVASRIPGYSRVLKNGKTGLLFTPGSRSSLVSRIIKLLDNQQLQRSIAEAGLKRCRDFEWRKIAADLSALYDDVLMV